MGTRKKEKPITVPSSVLSPELYKQAVREARVKFGPLGSIPRSAWIVKRYQALGGTYEPRKKTSKPKGIKAWFKENWISARDGTPCLRPSSDGTYRPCYPTKGKKATPDRKKRAVDRSRGRGTKTVFSR